MSLKLNSSGGGSVTLQEPTTASDVTLSLPAANTTIVGTDATQTLTNKTIQGGAITSGTAVASTSGTAIDFTGIPSWAKRITVMFSGVSTNGTSVVQMQLGDSGGVETSSYIGAYSQVFNAQTPTTGSFSSGFIIDGASNASAIRVGVLTIQLLDSATNLWAVQGNISRSDSVVLSSFAGSKTLSDTLTQVRITTVNGTDTFDAGTINILYEG